MKPIEKKQTMQSSGVQSSVSFGIKASGLHHILGILRNQLYSDKVLAVLREYSCNAVDAHTEVGKGDVPIEVTLPSKLAPEFKVRDFGPALSDEEIQDVYAFYGESTKRNSNDQIGMLGIGSKAAFAYGDNFVINSYIDGVKHSHNAYIDPSQIGQISKLSEESTTEKNGIEIVVPVNDSDVQEFADKAKNLFEWFKVRPKVHGQSWVWDKTETLFEGENWKWLASKQHGWNSDRGVATIVMGNIGYPIDQYALNLSGDDAELNSLLNKNLVIEAEIGDLEISASRESLQFTDYTRSQIAKRLRQVQGALIGELTTRFNASKTLYDAKCLYGSIFDYGSGLYSLAEVVRGKLKYKGKVVDSDSFSTYNHSGIVLHKFKRSHRGYRRFKPEEMSSLTCDMNTVVVHNDLGHRRGILGRILPLAETDGKEVYLIQADDKKSWDKFVKDEKFDAPMTELSSLPKHSLSEFNGYTNATGGSTGDKNPKHTAKVFSLDWDGIKSHRYGYGNNKSKFWKTADVDIANESGIYVIIDKFEILANNPDAESYQWREGSVHPTSMSQVKELLEQAGIAVPKVIAVKVAKRKSIEGKDGWTPLFDWLKNTIIAKMEEEDITQKFTDRNAASLATSGSSWHSSPSNEQTADVLAHIQLPEISLYAQYHAKVLEMLNDAEKKKIDAFIQMTREFGVKIGEDYKPKYDLPKLKAKVEARYTVLDMMSCWGGWRWDKANGEKIANYINVIDVCTATKDSA